MGPPARPVRHQNKAGSAVTVITEDQARANELDALMSYRDGYKNMFRVALALVLVIIALVVAVYYRVSVVIPHDRYYAETASGQRMQMTALPEPYINNPLLLDWAAMAATEILNFGFNDIDERFAQSRRYFSPEGWESFRASFAKSEVLRDVRAYQQVITAIPRTPPSILAQGKNAGKDGWLIEVPIIMTVRVAGAERMMRSSVRMFVVRLPTSVNPAGLGIFTWVVG